MKRIFIFSIAIITFGSKSLQAQIWQVPEDKAQKVSSFKFTDETKKKGEVVFQRNCISCHGNPGKGNFVNLVPSPGDPATERFQKQKDGELFYKLTTGRSPMPSFKDVLTEEERWQVLSYIRSFNKTYIQPEPKVIASGAYGGMDVSLNLDYLEKEKQLKVTAIGTKNNKTEFLSDVELVLFIKRYFGNLQIGEAKVTDIKGEAIFPIVGLPGDSSGNLNFIVKVKTEGIDGVKKEVTYKAGETIKKPSLIDTRAMWTVRSKAPIWLILAYSLVVISVWAVLIFIMLQIKKINKIGKEIKKENP